MSVPTNSLTLKQWFSLGETIAETNVDIGHVIGDDEQRHFSRGRFPELQSAAFDNLKSPALIFETPESGGIDQSANNLLATKYLAWTVAIRLEEENNFVELIDAEDRCEEIALQILSGLRQMRIHLGGLTFADVEMDKWEGDAVSPFLKTSWAGYRIMIPVKVTEKRLKYNPGKWTNDSRPPLMADLTRISCANLNDPTLGLTLVQRRDCILPTYNFADPAILDALTDQQDTDLTAAYGTGSPTPTTVNGTTSDTPTITVVQGGLPVGSLNPATGVVTVDECDECTPLGYDLHNTDGTVLLSGNVTDPCGATLELTAPDATVQLVDGKGSNIGEPVLFPSGTSGQMTAPSVLVQLVSSDSEPLGEEQTIHSGSALTTIVAPDAVVQLNDSDDNPIGGSDNYLSGSTNTKTAPDGTVKTTDGATTVMPVKSNGSANLPQSVIRYKDAADASQLTAAVDTVYSGGTLRGAVEVPRRELKNAGGTGLGVYATVARLIADTIPNCPIPLKFGWGAGNRDTLTWTVTSDEAGTYTTYTSDGGSGTITYSKNGGGFASVTGSITLAVSDTIIVRRTITTSQGFSRWVP